MPRMARKIPSDPRANVAAVCAPVAGGAAVLIATLGRTAGREPAQAQIEEALAGVAAFAALGLLSALVAAVRCERGWGLTALAFLLNVTLLLYVGHIGRSVAGRADAAKPADVKQKAQEVSRALLAGDYAKVADLTYPKAVEAAGGRDGMIAAAQVVIRQMNERGITLRSFAIDDPSELLTEGGNTFTVLPTTVEMAALGGRVVARSYLLGISGDGGKTWAFVDGSGLDTPEKRGKVLPKLPARLTLPEKQAPEFIKDK
jgi:hypothetical protein